MENPANRFVGLRVKITVNKSGTVYQLEGNVVQIDVANLKLSEGNSIFSHWILVVKYVNGKKIAEKEYVQLRAEEVQEVDVVATGTNTYVLEKENAKSPPKSVLRKPNSPRKALTGSKGTEETFGWVSKVCLYHAANYRKMTLSQILISKKVMLYSTKKSFINKWPRM
jgi:hypothetical protein